MRRARAAPASPGVAPPPGRIQTDSLNESSRYFLSLRYRVRLDIPNLSATTWRLPNCSSSFWMLSSSLCARLRSGSGSGKRSALLRASGGMVSCNTAPGWSVLRRPNLAAAASALAGATAGIYQDPTQGQVIAPNNAISGNNRDAHGFGLTASRTYLHQFDRVLNNVEVFHAGTGARNTYSLTTENVCGTTQGANYNSTNVTQRLADGQPNAVSVSNDPSPDLLDLSPHGNRFYVALRGPNPLSVSHAAAGSCPGLGVVELSADGKSGKLTHVIPTTWLDNAGTTNISDPHAAIVRLKD